MKIKFTNKNIKKDYLNQKLIDSLNFLNFIFQFKKKFQIKFDNNHFKRRNYRTIEGLSQLIIKIKNEKKINQIIKKLGLKKNDNVFIHSDISLIKNYKDKNDMDKTCNKLLLAILDVIGKKGTLAVPTFSYSFCKKRFMIHLKLDQLVVIFLNMLEIILYQKHIKTQMSL